MIRWRYPSADTNGSLVELRVDLQLGPADVAFFFFVTSMGREDRAILQSDCYWKSESEGVELRDPIIYRLGSVIRGMGVVSDLIPS